MATIYYTHPANREKIPVTPQEQEAADFIGKGFSNAQIAESLNIAAGTAIVHVGNLFKKTGFTREEIAVLARDGKTYPPYQRDISFNFKEAQIVGHLKEAKSIPEIIEIMNTTSSTVHRLLTSIYQKTGAGNHAELASFDLGPEFAEQEQQALEKLKRKMNGIHSPQDEIPDLAPFPAGPRFPSYEQKVMQGLIENRSLEEMAAQTGSNLKTLQYYRRNILNKIGFTTDEIIILERDGKLYRPKETRFSLTPSFSLTPREKELTGYIKENLSGREIMEKTGLSKISVREYLKHVYRKTGAEGHIDLAGMDLGKEFNPQEEQTLQKLKEKMRSGLNLIFSGESLPNPPTEQFWNNLMEERKADAITEKSK